VQVVDLPINRGFAGGSNAGIHAATGSLIALLNNDAVADARWLERLVGALNGRPDVGMIASRMLLRSSPDVVDSAGICLDSAGVAWDRGVSAPASSVAVPAEIFGASAGAALYRRAVFDDVGAFDEDFFMYLEDVDLAWRARLAGWRCVFAPDALVYHWHSATARENSAFKLYHLARNHVWTLVKNYPSPDVLVNLPTILIYEIAASLSAIILRPEPATAESRLAVIRGRLAGLRWIRSALAKRRIVQRQRRVPLWRVANELQPIAWLRHPLAFRARLARLPANQRQRAGSLGKVL
jgi:GT2 family glycosyltransferase